MTDFENFKFIIIFEDVTLFALIMKLYMLFHNFV